MNRLRLLAVAMTVFGMGCTSGSDPASDVAEESAGASACVVDHSADCPAAQGSQQVGFAYGLDALPSGACSATAACHLVIDPCPNWQAHPGERADLYGCACARGAWACESCSMGTGICLEPGPATTVQ